MRKGNGYRFTIQFGSITPRHEEVGELLERLKNKKAEYIVQAVGEYMRRCSEYGTADSCSSARVAVQGYISCAAATGESSVTVGVEASAATESERTNTQLPSAGQIDVMLDSLRQW